MTPERSPHAADTLATAAPLAWSAAEAIVRENVPLPGKSLQWSVVEVAAECADPLPGQFYMIAPADHPDALLLRRPMSVARAWREGGALRLGFLYTPVGRGTRALAASRDRWRILGPLGRGFPEDAAGPRLLVGGGRGVAPLVLLGERLAARGEPVVLLNGARRLADLCAPEDLGSSGFAPGSLILESTEDGSRGRPGRVLDLLGEPAVAERWRQPGAAIYACGPHGLLAACGRVASERGTVAWAAIEAHMACGTGICRSCVVPRAAGVERPAGASNADYILTCLEGPVVDAATVDWEKTP